MACAYCYVPRRKGYANPITVFVDSFLDLLKRSMPYCAVRYAF